MKIEPNLFMRMLTVDVQTRRDGDTAKKIAWDDDTEVFFGGLHAEVTLLDLRIRVIMDPDGTAAKWKDLKNARAQAMAVLCRPHVTPLFIAALAKLHFELGQQSGERKLQFELRHLLGVDTAIRLANAGLTFGDEL